MAHFALVEDNIVQNVIVIANEVLGEPDKTFPETESAGQDFIKNVLGLEGQWLQTSYSGSFRGPFAGIGYKYNTKKDVFVMPTIPEIDVTIPIEGA